MKRKIYNVRIINIIKARLFTRNGILGDYKIAVSRGIILVRYKYYDLINDK